MNSIKGYNNDCAFFVKKNKEEYLGSIDGSGGFGYFKKYNCPFPCIFAFKTKQLAEIAIKDVSESFPGTIDNSIEYELCDFKNECIFINRL